MSLPPSKGSSSEPHVPTDLTTFLSECRTLATETHRSAATRQREALSKLVEVCVQLQRESAELKTRLEEREESRPPCIDENTAMQTLATLQGDPITLDVGGTTFHTTRASLCAVKDSMLAAWFSGRHVLVTNKNGEIVMDRSPHYFSLILDYLRSGKKILRMPTTNVEREGLREEFDFFALPWPRDSETLVDKLRCGYTCTVLDGHTDNVLSVDMNETVVVSGAVDGTVRVWELSHGNCVHVLCGHTRSVTCVCLREGLVASGSFDKTVRVWGVDSGARVKCISTGMSVRCVGLGEGVVVGGGRNETVDVLQGWSIESGDVLWRLEGKTLLSRTITVYPQGFFLIADLDGVHRVDVASGGTVLEHKPNHPVQNAGIDAGKGVGWSVTGNACEWVVWERRLGAVECEGACARAECGVTLFLANGLHVGGEGSSLILTDMFKGGAVQLGGEGGDVTDVAIYGQRLAVASRDCKLRLWAPRMV